MAYQYKEEGNKFFKEGQFDKALAKYTRVSLFTKALMPLENKELANYMSQKVSGDAAASIGQRGGEDDIARRGKTDEGAGQRHVREYGRDLPPAGKVPQDH